MVTTTGMLDLTGVDALRDVTKDGSHQYSVEQMLTMVSMLREAWYGVDQIAAATGLTPDDVQTAVHKFGGWLIRTLRPDADAEIYDPTSAPISAYVQDTSQLTLFAHHTEGVVITPSGFSNIKKPVAHIVQTDPDEALVRRWLLRRNHCVHHVMGFEHVALVHRIAQLGRLGEIDELARVNGTLFTPWASVLVESYDFLESSRLVAVGAVEQLCEGRGDTDTLTDVLPRASWLSDVAFRGLSEAVDNFDEAALAIAVRDFGDQVRTDESLRPESIVNINDGQRQRLCEAAGIQTDEPSPDTKRILRAWILENGSDKDIPLLFPLGVRALHAGHGETFQEALSMRSEGNLDWSAELDTALREFSKSLQPVEL